MIKVAIFSEFPISSLSDNYTREGCSWLPQIADIFEQYRDFEIHWIILQRDANSYHQRFLKNQYFHFLPYWGLSKSLLSLRIKECRQFSKIIKKIKPNVVHCWGTENSYGAALFASDTPSILSMQGILSAFWIPGKLEGWRWNVMRYLEPHLIKRASLVTCESDWGLSHLKKLYPTIKTAKIEYGANSFFYDVSWQPDFKHPYFVFVGSLDHRKGVDILISMIKAYPKRSWRIVFAGMGPHYHDLEKLTSHNIELLGVVSPSRVSEILTKACALVLPTRADTSPNVVKEARVIGLPVVTTSHGGQASYVQHGVDGYIIDSEDPKEWFHYLNDLACNEARCRKFGEANHELYRRVLHPELTAQAFLSIYKSLAKVDV